MQNAPNMLNVKHARVLGVHNYVPNVSLTCGGVHPGWVSPRELTTSWIEAHRSCPSSLAAFTQPFLRRMQLKTRGPENSSRPSLSVLAHVLNWGSLISSLSGRLAESSNQRSLLWMSYAPAPHRLGLISLTVRRIRGDLICMYKKSTRPSRFSMGQSLLSPNSPHSLFEEFSEIAPGRFGRKS